MRSISTLILPFLLLATGAAAQGIDPAAGGLTYLREIFGGEATGGAAIAVIGAGTAPLATPRPQTYAITVEGRSDSAIEALRQHDDKLKDARQAARRFSIDLTVGPVGFTTELDAAAQRRLEQLRAARPSGPPMSPGVLLPPVGNEAERTFVARSQLRFSATNPQQLSIFLDALKAAGLTMQLQNSRAITLFATYPPVQAIGPDSVSDISTAIWDEATFAALDDARHEARTLAKASRREVGETKQIVLISRVVQGERVRVVVSVRFAFSGREIAAGTIAASLGRNR